MRSTRTVLLDPTQPARTRPVREVGPVDPRGRTVGLLENGKPNSRPILECLGELLRAECGALGVRLYRKPNASRPAPPELLAEMAREVEVAVTGIGD